MKVRAASAVLGLLLAARGAAAQPTQTSAELQAVAVGEKVLITTKDGRQVTGRLRSLTAESFAIETRDGPQTVPANRIGRLVVKDSVRNGLMLGLGIGAGAGLAGGLLVNAICVNETGSCVGTVLLLTAIGAGAGAGMGAGFDGLRHNTVFDVMPDVPREYSPELMVNVGLGRSKTRDTGFTGPVSAGGAWALRHTSGLGLAFEATTTVGHSTRAVSCEDERSGAAPAANCVAGGREGIVDTTTAAALAQYYFSNKRVQPYASGGAAIFQDSVSVVRIVRQPFGAGDSPFAFQAFQRQRGLALVAGGGARVVVTKHLSVRPDVTVYAGGRWTHVRVSVGAGIGW